MLHKEDPMSIDPADEAAASAGLSSTLRGKLLEFRKWQGGVRSQPKGFRSVDGTAQQGMVHDMNNLLMVINGFADVACSDPGLSPRSRLALENVMTATRKASYLAKQILSDAERAKKKKEGCNIAAALGEAVCLVSPLLGTDVCLKSPEVDPQLSAKCEPELFSRAITNLLINARDALPCGGVISVTADKQTLALRESKEYIRIRIQDDGIGMDAETQTRIFEPCFSTKGADRGSGLGLHMVSGFVEDCDGYLSLDSRKGRGSTFVLYLPSCKTNSSAQTTKSFPSGSDKYEEVE